MTAYVNRIGGTAGGLLSNKGRTATFTKLIDVAVQSTAVGATIVHTDTLAIATVPVGSYVSNVGVKVITYTTASAGATVAVGVTGAGTQFTATTPLTSGINVPVMAAYTTKYACTAATPIDILLTFNTAVPTGAKFLVSWTLEDTALVDPVTQV